MPALGTTRPTVAGMKIITNTKLFGAAALTVLALAGAGAAGTFAPSAPAAARTAAEDVSGPCDEAEHANDPRCKGTTAARKADDNHNHRRGKGSGRHGGRH